MTRLEQLKIQRTLTTVLEPQLQNMPRDQFIAADTSAFNTLKSAIGIYADYINAAIEDILEG